MAYSFSGRVRYSEIGENGLLTLPGILNYFQDCSTFQSEESGLGIEVLKEWKRFWVLSAWQVIVERYPCLGERIAYANTYWTYINAENGLPVKLTERDTAGYEMEEKLDMDYAPRKIILPGEYEQQEAFAVQKHHLDTNHHVNNCQYIQMAMDYLPADFKIHQMRAEYKQQARLYDVICPAKAEEDIRTTILLNDQKGEPYAVVEFEK